MRFVLVPHVSTEESTRLCPQPPAYPTPRRGDQDEGPVVWLKPSSELGQRLQDRSTDVVIDVPSGRVTARVHTTPDGRVDAVDFINVPSHLVAGGIDVSSAHGPCRVDLAWGGALYACIDARTVGLTVKP